MKKVFLSLGFNGRTEEEVRNDINKAKELITSFYPNEELEFIHNYDYIGNNKIDCLGEAIKKISTCDIVYFIGDFSNYRGCLIEHKLCILYNMPYCFIDNEITTIKPQ